MAHYKLLERCFVEYGYEGGLMAGFLKGKPYGYTYFVYDTEWFDDPKAALKAVHLSLRN